MERSKTCQGCIYDSPGQLAHMEEGGCLSAKVEDEYLPVYINGIKYNYSTISGYLYNLVNEIVCRYNFEKGTLHPI
jgi:hypothetical protein